MNGPVANSECEEAGGNGNDTAMPKIVWMNLRWATASPR